MTSRLRIDLGAVADNYRMLREHAYADVAAVVKANSYGLGVVAIAQRLWSTQCRTFFVATAEEGVLLRQTLATADIYVLEGVQPSSLEELVRHQLIPVLNTPEQCRIWSGTNAPAGLHVDTGMQRLGLDFDELSDVLAGVLHLQSLRIGLFVSHLARADEPDNAFNQLQLERVREAYRSVNSLYPNLKLSLTNSAGMLEGVGPEHIGRAGIGLYGGNPFTQRDNPMRSVLTFEAQVLQVRRVQPGTPVGYGGSYVASRESRIATVGAGYADGVPRLLSDRGRVFAEGNYYPIVGRVSMDMLHVDVTEGPINEGGWLEICGGHVSVDEVADHAQTLAYEILTGLGERPTRQYIN